MVLPYSQISDKERVGTEYSLLTISEKITEQIPSGAMAISMTMWDF